MSALPVLSYRVTYPVPWHGYNLDAPTFYSVYLISVHLFRVISIYSALCDPRTEKTAVDFSKTDPLSVIHWAAQTVLYVQT